MSDKGELAAALCAGVLPSREIAGLVYVEAVLEEPIEMPTPPDHISVKRAAKTGWVKSATAIRSRVPELVGSGMIPLRSVRAKREFILHGNDAIVLHRLEDLALENSHTARVWATKVDPHALLKRICSGEEFSYAVHAGLGENLVQHGAEHDPRVLKIKDKDVRDTVCVSIIDALFKSKALERAVSFTARFGSKARNSLVARAFSEMGGPIDRAHLGILEAIIDKREVEAVLAEIDYGQEATDDFVEHVFDAYPAAATNYIERLDLPRWAERLAQLGTQKAVQVLLSAQGSDIAIERDHIQRAVRRNMEISEVDQEEWAWPDNFLSEWKQPLDRDVVLHILRRSETRATLNWLSGEGVNPPQAGMFEALCNNPGMAFGTRWYRSRSTREDFVNDLAANLPEVLNKPWSDEVVEVLGAPLTHEMIAVACSYGWRWGSAERQAVASYLARRFNEELGDDLEAWQLALAAVPRSTQPLGRTLKGIRRIVKHRASSDRS